MVKRGGDFPGHREFYSPESTIQDFSHNRFIFDNSTISFLIFFLITSSMELYLGSPNGFSLIKIVSAIIFASIIEYIVRTNLKSGHTDSLPWILIVVYFVTYFTITIVATSCAKFNMKQLRDLRDFGLVSPFVLSKKQIDDLKKDNDKHDKHDKNDKNFIFF